MKTTYKKHWASPTRIITTKERKLTIPEWFGVVFFSILLAIILSI